MENSKLINYAIKVEPAVAAFLKTCYGEQPVMDKNDSLCKALKLHLHRYKEADPYKNQVSKLGVQRLSDSLILKIPESYISHYGHSWNVTNMIRFNKLVKTYIFEQFSISMLVAFECGQTKKKGLALARTRTGITVEHIDDQAVFRDHNRRINRLTYMISKNEHLP